MNSGKPDESTITFFVLIVFVFLELLAHHELKERSWELYSSEHHCVLLKTEPGARIHAGYIDGHGLKEIKPDTETWRCDNGLIVMNRHSLR